MEFRVLRVPPRAKVLVTGLPDMGNVAGIAMEVLVRSCNLEEFASAQGKWPPFVTHTGSMIRFERGWYRFYGSDAHDFVALTGSFQPPESSELYELCNAVLDLAQSIGVETVVSLGAAHFGEGFIENPRVFFAATSDRMAERARFYGAVPLLDEGYITGYNGLIHGLAVERGMEGLCLLGEIGNPRVRQPAAAKAVLQVLSAMLNVSIDYTELDREIEQIKAMRALRRGRRDLPPGVM
jgi:predicted ATP-grasp superfamily ATP-dependent carboligase